MKKIFFLTNLILILVFISPFVSCEKDEDYGTVCDVSIETISAKWEISDINSPFISFEFSKDGNYIVLENKSPIHFGKYMIDKRKIILIDFGYIDVTILTDIKIFFSFTLEATEKKTNLIADKSKETISPSVRSEMICRTWVVQELTVDEETQLNDSILGTILLFSKTGTYLVLYGGEESKASLFRWKWADIEETKIYYSWKKWEDDWEKNIVIIEQLNNDSLVFHENFGAGEWVYYMIPRN